MGRYEIWSEGFQATGGGGTATLHGKVKAKSFEEAILKFALEHESFFELLDYRPNNNSVGSDYTYWGCRLYDNESEARSAFG